MSIDYIMESSEEILRLDRKTEEEIVRIQARKAGLRAGMRVADVCCGSGKTTAILREEAGVGGSAVGIDGSAERIAHAVKTYGSPSTTFARRDIRSDLEDLGSFDFVWVRFILEYFRLEARDVVRGLSRIVKPGGILCLIDLDHNCLNHWGLSPRLEKALVSSIAQLEEKGNFDPYAGRKLYSHLYELGFRNIEADAGAHHLIYGKLRDTDAFNWIKKIEVLSKRLEIEIPGYDSVEEFKEDFREFFSNPGRFTYTPLIACWGRRPE